MSLIKKDRSIIPKYKGGKSTYFNLVTLCRYCHWYLHANPKFRINISNLVKEAYKNKGEKVRAISKEIGVSLGKISELAQFKNNTPNKTNSTSIINS
jgi:hypothetical protein